VQGTALRYLADLDTYIVKLDPSWNVSWARTFGGAGDQRGRQVAVDGLGRVYVAGDSLGTLDVDGTIYDNPVGIDGFLIELDSDGNVLSSEVFTSPSKVFVSMMDVDSAGTVTVAGHFIDEIDIFGIKLMGEADGFDDIYVARRPPH
jgi:hypothetical protein